MISVQATHIIKRLFLSLVAKFESIINLPSLSPAEYLRPCSGKSPTDEFEM